MGYLNLFAIFIWLLGSSVTFANQNTGKHIFETQCQSCHGAVGVSTDAPILFGQEPSYLRKALADFKGDLRKDHIMSSMPDIAKGLKDDQIAKLSTYLAGQEPCSIKIDIDPSKEGYKESFLSGRELYTKNRCDHCHGSFHHMAPRLYGQKQIFIQKTLEAFQSGARKNGIMTQVVKDLSENEVRDLANFISGMRMMRTCQ